MDDGQVMLQGSDKHEYVTIIELTNEKGEKNLVNLFSSTPEGAFANVIQVEQIYKKEGVATISIVGTYGKTSFAVIDRNKSKEI